VGSSLAYTNGKLDTTNAALAHANGSLKALSALPDLDRKRDALSNVRDQLEPTNSSLSHTNAGIDEMKTSLKSVADVLGSVHSSLNVLGSMNESLKNVATRIDRSLIGRRSFWGL